MPVILIRDYGVWGWVIFAVPNVLGATAMAYVLAKPEMSKEMVERHKIACSVFSIITILFQIYFIGWIGTIVPNIFTLAVCVVLVLIYVSGSRIDDNQRFSAFIVWILSLICLILTFHFVPVEKIDLFKSGNLIHNTNALLHLTPVFIFGFLLCPYLDLTFHKVRQSNTLLNSKIAFTVGFCFMFLLMIVFTFFYARPVASIIEGVSCLLKDQSQLPLIYIYVLTFHMLIQAGLTVFFHLRLLLPIIRKNNRNSFLLVILGVVIYLLPVIFNANHLPLGMTINEFIYRVFMAFYSLIAPSYVFLFVIPKNKKNISLNNYNLLVWITAVLFALPFYAIAFLGVKWNLEICVLAGLAIVLFSRVLVKPEGVNL